MDIAGATSSTLTLASVGASASGRYSVVVRNAIGSVVSATASLAVLTDGANGNQPTPVAALFCPPAPANKDSLILITHGVAPGDHLAGREQFGDISWITNMASAIRAKVAANWEVRTLDWTTNSQLTGPDSVAFLGTSAGRLYGQQLARQQPWAHVHLIAHSAGAAVIEAIAAELKALPSPLQIHETFLDPFLGYAERDLSGYGKNADWADNYFSRDGGTGWTTDGALLTFGLAPTAHVELHPAACAGRQRGGQLRSGNAYSLRWPPHCRPGSCFSTAH